MCESQTTPPGKSTPPGSGLIYRGGCSQYSLAIALPVSPSLCSEQSTLHTPAGKPAGFLLPQKKSPTVATRLGGAAIKVHLIYLRLGLGCPVNWTGLRLHVNTSTSIALVAKPHRAAIAHKNDCPQAFGFILVLHFYCFCRLFFPSFPLSW